MAGVALQLDIDDAEVRRRILSGDRAAWKILVDRYECRLKSFLRLKCRPLDVEDVVQETWIKLMSKIQEWDPEEGRFWSWLMKISQNLAIDLRRKSNRRDGQAQSIENSPEPAGESIKERIAESDRIIALRDCLAEAAGDHIQTLQLQLQGFSGQEISKMLDIAGGTVSSRISRAKDLVEECLKRKMP